MTGFRDGKDIHASTEVSADDLFKGQYKSHVLNLMGVTSRLVEDLFEDKRVDCLDIKPGHRYRIRLTITERRA